MQGLFYFPVFVTLIFAALLQQAAVHWRNAQYLLRNKLSAQINELEILTFRAIAYTLVLAEILLNINMKISTIYFIFFLVSWITFLNNPCQAQIFSVSNRYKNYFYLGMQTPLDVIVQGSSCRSIKLKSAIGTIEKQDCYFTYYPKKVGIDTITVFTFKSGKSTKIGQVNFLVKEIPDPEPSIGGFTNGFIKKGALIAQSGVGASQLMTSYGHKESAQIDSFTVIIFRGQEMIFSGHNKGNLFNDTLKNIFPTLKAGDRLTVTNIKSMTVTSKIILLRPIELEIIE